MKFSLLTINENSLSFKCHTGGVECNTYYCFFYYLHKQ
jgi:Zn-finger protein